MRPLARITARLVPLALFLLTPTVHAADVVEYYHTDGIGNVRVVTDAAGAVIERHDYLPFGEEWCGTAVCGANRTPGQPLRFTGKERDAETGLDYFGARYYRANAGRFTTVDPAMNVKAGLVDPQRWNRYVHVLNNPLRVVDPDGREGALLRMDMDNRDLLAGRITNEQYAARQEARGEAIADVLIGAFKAVFGIFGQQGCNPLPTAPPTGWEASNETQAGAMIATGLATLAAGTRTSVSLYRAAGTTEMESIAARGAFTAAPNGTEYKGFFFAKADAQSFATKISQRTGDTHTVVSASAPGSVVRSSPAHSAAGEGPGTLIRNADLPKVRVGR